MKCIGNPSNRCNAAKFLQKLHVVEYCRRIYIFVLTFIIFFLQLEFDRTILDTHCNCKAGKGFCKHAAAICIFVNVENTCSKTDQPMIWNRPPQIQLDKYHKGCRIETLFPCEGNRQDQVFGFEDLKNINDQHLSEDSPQTKIIKSEIECHNQRQERMLEQEKRNIAKKSFLEKLYYLQSNSSCQIYNGYNCLSTQNMKTKFAKISCPQEYLCKYEEIKVDKEKWMEIAFNFIGQSNTYMWLQQRRTRITCSEKAHRIKTRVANFDTLAEQLSKQKNKALKPIAMQYGLEMESTARLMFQETYGYRVHEVGLIVSLKQPYLACSPDGIIDTGENMELLEIKCPYSCENTKIVDFQTKMSFVPYLMFDKNGELFLKENDKYYTQIQVSMYILGIQMCYFFVYSSQDHVCLKIPKNESFLSILIPKIEMFYFEYFIQSS